MEAYQVILLILVLVAFFYIAIIVYVMSMMLEFRNKLRRRRRGINLILYERCDVLLSFIELFRMEGVVFSEVDAQCFDALSALDFKNKYDEESLVERGEAIKAASSRIRYLAQANRWATKGKEYEHLVSLLKDLDRNYRLIVGQYNMDVGGYNYWIAVPGVHWIGFLVGFRKKALLN